MIDTLLTTVFASTLFISSAMPAQPAAPKMTFTQTLPEKQYISYTAQENESLQAISLRYYGATEYWTNVWNDNPTVKDPEAIVAGTHLNIRHEKPAEAAALEDVLQSNHDALLAEKNEAYLAQLALMKPTQAPLPTQAPVAQPANVASPISEEAITYLGNCEAGMNPTRNSGNGYYGAFQFSYGTWKSLNTGYERADLAPIEVQKAAVKQLLQRSSIYNQFPGCARKMRSAGLI